MTLPILILLAAAIAFAATAGWLATGRGRSRSAWSLFGAILGPIALVVLFAAPPGRCPTCGMRTRGWPTVCASCDRAFGTAPSAVATPAVTPAATPVGRPDATRHVAATALGTRPEMPSPAAAPVPAPVAQGGRRRAGGSADRLGPDATVVATGVFVGGSAPVRTGVSLLQIGERYGIARTAGEVQVVGPVYVDPDRILARLPATGATASLDNDRLVVTWPSDGGARVAFNAVAIARGIDPAARLSSAVASADPAVGT